MLAIGGLVVGLLPYVYLVATAENPMSWGRHIDGLHAVIRHFLREDYGGPSAFAPNRDAAVPMVDNLEQLGVMLGRTWLWAPLVLGIAALVDRLARARAGEPRWGWAMLALTFVIAGPLLVLRFNVPLEGPGIFTVNRFLLMPALILAVPIAIGIDRVGELIVTRVGARRRVGEVIAVGLFVALAAVSLPFVQMAHSPAVELGVRNMLESLPQGAVAIISEDDLDFGSGYVQLVLHERPDVVVIMWTAVPSPAYRERLEETLGIRVPANGADLLSIQFADAVLARGHMLFVDGLQSHILQMFPTYPFGILYRVLPHGAKRPPIDEVLALNKAIYEKFSFGYPVPSIDADWPAHVHLRYARTWQIIRDALIAEGKHDDAAFANQMEEELRPR